MQGHGGWTPTVGFQPGAFQQQAQHTAQQQQLLQQQAYQQAMKRAQEAINQAQQAARNPLGSFNTGMYRPPAPKPKVKVPKKQRAQQQQQQQMPHLGGEQQDDMDEDDVGDGLEEGWFAAVSTEHLEKMGLRPHPDPIAEAASLSSVAPPEPKHKLCLPKHVLQDGISAAQFQAVNLAVSRHELSLKNGERAGFFLGDGPGVGKGRQISATILHYFCQGKTRAIWISVSTDLVVDAHRDLDDIGALQYDAVRLHDLRQLKLKKGQKLESLPGLDKGILFCTYDLLISGAKKKPKDDKEPMDIEEEFGEGSRLSQIVEWLGTEDYLIVLDECHKAKNCLSKDDKTAPCPIGDEGDMERMKKDVQLGKIQGESKTARAVIELQRRCPNARLMYVSATGATEAENLGYMERLGLWGRGTPYASKREFTGMLKKGGVAAMELVAMELKHAGAYIARTLSYEKVVFETVHEEVAPAFETLYDTAAELWQDTRAVLKDHGAPKEVMRAFYGAQLRFFRQMVTAAKVDKVVELAQKALDEGHSPVIGLQSTGEARTAAYVRAHGGDDASFDSFVEPAALVLTNFIKQHMIATMPEAEVLRARAKVLQLPKNPLDDLIERLGGPSNVAEMTGRAKRMLRESDGSYKYLSRVTDDIANLDEVNIREREAFQAGHKRVAVISDAASAGISIQADRKAKNQAKRIHITLELAWSADKTVQQLGRTHRSNQCHPPKYIIVSTNISGERRFASAVAARLEQLGALTQGDRRAASAADALSAFNLQNIYASKALSKMYKIINSFGSDNPGNIKPPWLEEKVANEFEGQEAPEPDTPEYVVAQNRVLNTWFDAATKELQAVGLIENNKIDSNVNKLLNRLLAARVEMQASVFAYFGALVDEEVKSAKQAGEFECGIIKPGCTDIKLKSSTTIHLNEDSMLPTEHLKFTMDRGVSWERAQQLLEQENASNPDTIAGFYYTQNTTIGTKYCLAFERNAKGRCERNIRGMGRRKVANYLRLIRPDTGYAPHDMHWKDFKHKYAKCTGQAAVKAAWQETFRRNTQLRMQEVHLISGSVLPLIPTINEVMTAHKRGLRNKKLQMMRVEAADTNKRYIGVHVPEVVLKYMTGAILELQPHKPWTKLSGLKEAEVTAAQQRANTGAAAAGAAAAAGGASTSAAAAAAAAAAGGASTSAAAGAAEIDAAVAKALGAHNGSDSSGDSSSDEDTADVAPKKRRKKRARKTAGRQNHKRAALAAAPKRFADDETNACEKLLEAGLWAAPGQGLALKPALALAREKAARGPKISTKGAKKMGGRRAKDALFVEDDEEEVEVGSSSGSESDAEGSGASGSESEGGDGEKRKQRSRATAARQQPRRRAAPTTMAIDISDDEEAAGGGDDGSDHEEMAGTGVAAVGKGRGRGAAASAAKRKPAAAAAGTAVAAVAGSEDVDGSSSSGSEESSSEEEMEDAEVALVVAQKAKAAKGRKGKAAQATKGGRAAKQQQQQQEEEEDDEEELFEFEPEPGVEYKVDCRCGVTYDDGDKMIECEQCFTWQHIKCLGVRDPKAAFVCDGCAAARADKAAKEAAVAAKAAARQAARQTAKEAVAARQAAKAGAAVAAAAEAAEATVGAQAMQQEEAAAGGSGAGVEGSAHPSNEELKARLISILDEAAGTLSLKGVLAKLQDIYGPPIRTRKAWCKDIILQHVAAQAAAAVNNTAGVTSPSVNAGAGSGGRAVATPARSVAWASGAAGAAVSVGGPARSHSSGATGSVVATPAHAAGAAAHTSSASPMPANAAQAAASAQGKAVAVGASKRAASTAAVAAEAPTKRRRLQQQQQEEQQEEDDVAMADLCDNEETAGQVPFVRTFFTAQRRRAAAALDSDDDSDDADMAADVAAVPAKTPGAVIARAAPPVVKPASAAADGSQSTPLVRVISRKAAASAAAAAAASGGSAGSPAGVAATAQGAAAQVVAAAQDAMADRGVAAAAAAQSAAASAGAAAQAPPVLSAPMSPGRQEQLIQERVAKEVAVAQAAVEQKMQAQLLPKLKQAKELGIKKAQQQLTPELDTLRQQAEAAAQQLLIAQEAATKAAAMEAARAQEAARWEAQASEVVKQQQELQRQLAAQQQQQRRQERQQEELAAQMVAQQERFRVQMEEAAAVQRALMEELLELRKQRTEAAAAAAPAAAAAVPAAAVPAAAAAVAPGAVAAAPAALTVPPAAATRAAETPAAEAAQEALVASSPVEATPMRTANHAAAAATPGSAFVLHRMLSPAASLGSDGALEAAPQRADSANAGVGVSAGVGAGVAAVQCGTVQPAAEEQGRSVSPSSLLATPTAAPAPGRSSGSVKGSMANEQQAPGTADAMAVLPVSNKELPHAAAAAGDGGARSTTPTAAPVTPGAAPVTPEVTPAVTPAVTPSVLFAWLQQQPRGVTAPAILQSFLTGGATATEAGAAAGPAGAAGGGIKACAATAGVLSKQLATCLQQLIDEVDVIRQGSSATNSCEVDMQDGATLYMALA